MECDLSFLDCDGIRFTWDNRRKDYEFIQERLDYALTNSKWNEHFPGTNVIHVDRQGSDHVPILVYPLRVEVYSYSDENGYRPSKFKAMWFDHEGCQEVVKNVWNNPNHGRGGDFVPAKIERCL